MKVIIFAGGFGTRLGNRTNFIPKPMVEIGDKPVIWHIMKIFSHYGYNDFILCLGYKGNVIKDYFYNYENKNNDFTIKLKTQEIQFHNKSEIENWSVTLADTGLKTLKGGRLKKIEKYLDDEINFITYGDGVADINIDDLLEFHKQHNKPVTITGVHPPARFGELIENNNIVQSFEEKPQTSKGLINGGFMVVNNSVFEKLHDDSNCDFEVGILEELTEEGQVMVYKHKGNWECIDNERDLQHLNKLWDEEKAFWKVWVK